MSPTGDGNGTGETPRRWAQVNPEAAAEYQRRYREANPEKIAELRRQWRERNPERSREINRESARRHANRQRQRAKRNAHGRKWYAEHREEALERSRRFRTENPEKVREYQRRYKERHPEKARQSGRQSAQRNRDANADHVREKQRVAAAARREQNPDEFKAWYARNLEAQRERGRAASRLRSRLKKLGLPPRRIHRVYADERRAHDAAATEYFSERRSVDVRGAIAAESPDENSLDLPKIVAQRRRAFLRAQSAPLARDPEDPLANGQYQDPPPELFQWRRARNLAALKESHERVVEAIRAERPQIYEKRRERREARLREGIRMDSIARTVQGLPAYDMEEELRVRLDGEVSAIINRRLTTVRDETIARAENIVRRRERGRDDAAPHQPPGAQPGRGLDL